MRPAVFSPRNSPILTQTSEDLEPPFPGGHTASLSYLDQQENADIDPNA